MRFSPTRPASRPRFIDVQETILPRAYCRLHQRLPDASVASAHRTLPQSRPGSDRTGPQMTLAKVERALFGVIARVPERPFDEAQVAALRMHLESDRWIRSRCLARDGLRRNERIVLGGEQQQRHADTCDIGPAGALRPAPVPGSAKSRSTKSPSESSQRSRRSGTCGGLRKSGPKVVIRCRPGRNHAGR